MKNVRASAHKLFHHRWRTSRGSFFFYLLSRERFQRLLPPRRNRLCGFTSSQLASLLARKKRKKEKKDGRSSFWPSLRSKSEYIGARNRYKLNSPTFRPTYFSSLLGETRFLEDTRSESIRILRFSTPTRSFRGSLADRLTPERALEICWPSLHYRLARTSIRSAKYPQVTMGDTSNVITVDEFRVTGRVGLSGRIQLLCLLAEWWLPGRSPHSHPRLASSTGEAIDVTLSLPGYLSSRDLSGLDALGWTRKWTIFSLETPFRVLSPLYTRAISSTEYFVSHFSAYRRKLPFKVSYSKIERRTSSSEQTNRETRNPWKWRKGSFRCLDK